MKAKKSAVKATKAAPSAFTPGVGGYTIESDDEIPMEKLSDDEEMDETFASEKSKKNDVKVKKKAFSFEFDDGNNYRRGADEEDEISDVGVSDDDESSDDSDNDDDNEDDDDDNVRLMLHTEERAIRAIEKSKRKKQEDPVVNEGMDEETEAQYFDSVIQSTAEDSLMFTQLNLSRPLLRAIEAAGYVTPTPVQAKVIPLAMAGRDVCASAVTGSGKTAAFVLPFLERLLFRPKDDAAIRVLILSPTRELATQTFKVLNTLAQFTDITCALICGGVKDVKNQEAVLRNRPDVIVCTPGRIIDHLRNSHSVNIDNLDVLVLDEVDRLLDMGFQEEVEELLKYCPVNRQTLLFSATMTPKVDDLAKLSLKRPVRVKTASNVRQVAPRLIQEFVKVRNDDEKEAMLAALIVRTFNKKCILFCETKKDAHRFYVILKLLGMQACELHGDINQSQRYAALNQFRENKVDIMVCTDVAARGLDIQGIQTVINAEMPSNSSTYIHRVGRTARAGCGGRSITLVNDNRRKCMKEVLKGEGSTLSQDGGQVLSRTIPSATVSQYLNKIASLKDDIVDTMKRENHLAKIARLESEADRVSNMIKHQDEIQARPARTWYQSESEKKALKEASKQQVLQQQTEVKAPTPAELTAEQKYSKLLRTDNYEMEEKQGKSNHRLSRKKRRKLDALASMEEDDHLQHSLDRAPKRMKNAAREKVENVKKLTATELGGGKTVKGTNKVIRPKIAVGGLEQDMLDWGGSNGSGGISKKQKKADARAKEFVDFDPEKRLRKEGKIGRKAFKSKSKFKRR